MSVVFVAKAVKFVFISITSASNIVNNFPSFFIIFEKNYITFFTIPRGSFFK